MSIKRELIKGILAKGRQFSFDPYYILNKKTLEKILFDDFLHMFNTIVKKYKKV